MKNYFVEFQLGKDMESIRIEASDPGHAFQKALRKLPPKAIIIRAHIEGKLAGISYFQRVWIDYEAPKNMRLEAPEFPCEKFQQTTMPFV